MVILVFKPGYFCTFKSVDTDYTVFLRLANPNPVFCV